MSDENFVQKGNGFVNAIKSVQRHTNAAQKRKIGALSVLVFFSAIMDVVGLAAVLPLIQAGSDPKLIHSNKYLSAVYDYFGFATDQSFVLFLIGFLLAYFLFKTAFGIFVNWLQARLTADIAVYITKNQFIKYYKLDYLDFSAIKSSLLMRNILYNPTSYVQWIVQPLTMILSEFIIVFLIIGAIAYYDLFLFGFILLTIGPATYLVYAALKKRGTAVGIGIDNVFPYALSSLTEAISGYIDIKLAGKVENYRKRYLKHLKNYQELQQSAYLLSMIPIRTNEIIALLGIILIFMYALFLSDGSADVLIMVGAFGAAAYRLMPSMNRILNSFMYINKNQVSIYNLEIFDELVKDDETTDSVPVKFDQKITFDNISFKFPNSEKQILKNLNFEVRKGEKIGFVGSSGSGKTTLMNILLRFYHENGGNILVDGKPLTTGQTQNWRTLIGYVKQDIFLLDGTIRDNITLGDAEVDEDRAPGHRKRRGQRHPQRQFRKGADDLDQALDQVVDPSAVVAGDTAQHDADRKAHQDAQQADRQRDAGAVDDPREHVAPDVVGAEQEARIGEWPDQGTAGERQRVARIEPAGADRHGDDHQQLLQVDGLGQVVLGASANRVFQQRHTVQTQFRGHRRRLTNVVRLNRTGGD
mgnify:CR=1 FL=1